MNFSSSSTSQNENNEARLEKLILGAAGTCVLAMIYLLISALI